MRFSFLKVKSGCLSSAGRIVIRERERGHVFCTCDGLDQHLLRVRCRPCKAHSLVKRTALPPLSSFSFRRRIRSPHPTAVSRHFKIRMRLTVTTAVLLFGLWSVPLYAQQAPPAWAPPHDGSAPGYATPPRSSAQGGASNLPGWAEPAASSHRVPGADVTAKNTPPLPPPGNRVPIDGGLGWLAAAGAAYAVHRLRRENRDDEEVDRNPV